MPGPYLGSSRHRSHPCTPRLCGRSRCPTRHPGCWPPPAAGGHPSAARTCAGREGIAVRPRSLPAPWHRTHRWDPGVVLPLAWTEAGQGQELLGAGTLHPGQPVTEHQDLASWLIHPLHGQQAQGGSLAGLLGHGLALPPGGVRHTRGLPTASALVSPVQLPPGDSHHFLV